MNRLLLQLIIASLFFSFGCDSSPRSFRPGQGEEKAVKATVLKALETTKNSIGMRLVKVPSGKFLSVEFLFKVFSRSSNRKKITASCNRRLHTHFARFQCDPVPNSVPLATALATGQECQ